MRKMLTYVAGWSMVLALGYGVWDLRSEVRSLRNMMGMQIAQEGLHQAQLFNMQFQFIQAIQRGTACSLPVESGRP